MKSWEKSRWVPVRSVFVLGRVFSSTRSKSFDEFPFGLCLVGHDDSVFLLEGVRRAVGRDAPAVSWHSSQEVAGVCLCVFPPACPVKSEQPIVAKSICFLPRVQRP